MIQNFFQLIESLLVFSYLKLDHYFSHEFQIIFFASDVCFIKFFIVKNYLIFYILNGSSKQNRN